VLLWRGTGLPGMGGASADDCRGSSVVCMLREVKPDLFNTRCSAGANGNGWDESMGLDFEGLCVVCLCLGFVACLGAAV
jgi:hypothetical protein